MRRHSKSIVFNLLFLCLGIFFSADYFQSTVLASPIAEVDSLELRDLIKRYSSTPSGKVGNRGPANSDYPSDDEINQSRIKLPTLIAGDIKITLIDYSNFDNKKDYPLDLPNIYPGILPRKVHGGLLRRQDYYFDWQGDREDPADPDSNPQIRLDYYSRNYRVHLQQVRSGLPSLLLRRLAHSFQYQKNEGQAASNGNGATSDYRFTIQLKDDQHEDVGGVDYYDAPGGQGVDVTSALPLVFIATAGNVDHDPVSFAYGSQSWKSSDGQCSVGGYDKGSRQMDCGFSC
ncbi:MAG: hypothetical protein Q9202_005085 [Teloschistes flavicans]